MTTDTPATDAPPTDGPTVDSGNTEVPAAGPVASPARLVLTPPDTPVRREAKVLGRTDAGPDALVRLPVIDARHHVHVIGSTGTGKSTALLRLALGDIAAGRGCAVIEPRGDLIRDLLDRIPAAAANRIVLIDPDESTAPVSLNILDPAGTGQEAVAEQLVSTLHRIYSAWWGPRVEDTLRACALTLVGRPGATLADIPMLLTNPTFRATTTAEIRRADPAGIGAFWEAYDTLSPAQLAAATGPVLSKLRAVTTRRFVADLLGTAASTFAPTDILDGGILLVRLPKGELGDDTVRLVGSLLLAALWQAAVSRAGTPEHARADCAVYVDEAHNFLHLPTPLGDALAEARGYHVSFVLAHQHLAQLTPELRAALDANARNKLIFAVSPDDARHLAPHVGPYLQPADLHHLDAYQAACRLTVDNRDTTGFTLRTLPAPPTVPSRAEHLRAAARARGLDRAQRAQIRARRRRDTPLPHTAHRTPVPITDL